MRRLAFGTLILCVAVVAGCGGGGGGGAALLDAGTTIRQIQPGDQVTYTISGTATDRHDNSVHALGGTATMSVFADTVAPTYGTRALKMVLEMHLTVEATPVLVTSTIYGEQDAAGTIYFTSTDNGSGPVRLTSSTSPPISYPSPTTVGNAYSYTTHYSDASSDDNSVTVADMQPAAGYNAFRIHSVVTGGSVTTTTDDWFVPKVGFPVRTTGDTQNTDLNLHVTLTLSSKNF